jgi:hypothetical protein
MPPNSFNPAEIEAALGGRFKIEREIRAGAQGAVFRAQRIEDPAGLAVDNDVALKVYFETVELPVGTDRNVPLSPIEMSHPGS